MVKGGREREGGARGLPIFYYEIFIYLFIHVGEQVYYSH